MLCSSDGAGISAMANLKLFRKRNVLFKRLSQHFVLLVYK